MKCNNIIVIGMGYVGIVTATCLAEKGNKVIGVDIDENKIDSLKLGSSPIYEKGIEKLIRKNIKKKRLFFSKNCEEIYNNADYIFITVGTPEKDDGDVDLEYVYDASKKIADNIKNDCIVIVKSTVSIGTCDMLEKYINMNLKNKVKINVVSNPEFLSQGTAIRDTLNATRIIIGVESEIAKKKMEKLYKLFKAPKIFTDRKSAEMIKYSSNNFLALRISYINDIANLCELTGANIEDVAKGMGYDNRIGNSFFNAGIGYGGSCFPKDTKALKYIANKNKYQLKTVEATIEINEYQKTKLFTKALERVGKFNGLNVAVLGVTFKPETDDLRESPAIINIDLLLKHGANVFLYDPVGMNNAKNIYKNKIYYADNIEETLKNSDICFIFTEWNEIKKIKAELFRKLMRTPLVYDGRNIYNPKIMKDNNIEYYSIGR